ncbi:MAG: hypothetical protein JSV43_02215 [Methanobacteriota archaeon]|nr:MAG: hypothetical protein JSV43_02215 [Euryarchaeota archaeon]
MEGKRGTKSLVLTMDFADNRFAIVAMKEKREPISKHAEMMSRDILATGRKRPEPGYVHYDIVSSDNRILYRGVFPDPTYSRVEFQPETGSLRSAYVTHEKARCQVTVPYYPAAVNLRLRRVNPEGEMEDLGVMAMKVRRG